VVWKFGSTSIVSSLSGPEEKGTPRSEAGVEHRDLALARRERCCAIEEIASAWEGHARRLRHSADPCASERVEHE
jgi:hypothetical protein